LFSIKTKSTKKTNLLNGINHSLKAAKHNRHTIPQKRKYTNGNGNQSKNTCINLNSDRTKQLTTYNIKN
jgi:hypothetical protein